MTMGTDDARTDPQPPSAALRDQMNEAKLSCESTAIILYLALMGGDERSPPSADELENFRDTATHTIAALEQLLAVLPPR